MNNGLVGGESRCQEGARRFLRKDDTVEFAH